jgi:hypothetical protein
MDYQDLLGLPAINAFGSEMESIVHVKKLQEKQWNYSFDERTRENTQLYAGGFHMYSIKKWQFQMVPCYTSKSYLYYHSFTILTFPRKLLPASSRFSVSAGFIIKYILTSRKAVIFLHIVLCGIL